MPDNFYTMSDEDLALLTEEQLTLAPEDFEESDEASQEMPDDSTDEDAPDTEDYDNSDTDSDDEGEYETETEESFEEDSDEVSDEDDETDNDTLDVTQDDSDDEETSDEGDKETGEEHDTQESDVDLKLFYESLTKPFKANGKDMTVTNPDDMITLMQQGANYSQKMAKLKPQMALIKTLEKHKLNDPEQLSYLIDLHNKDPKAIAKLVKDADINIYELDINEAEDYVPSQKVTEDTPLEAVINDLNDSPGFNGLLNIVANEWDAESRSFVVNTPAVLRTLTSQRESGLYDKIMSAVEYERMCGRMTDIPLLEAYSYIENKFLEEEVASQPAAKEKFIAPRPKANKNAELSQKKRRASAPTGSKQQTNTAIDPLRISDEELMKLF